MRRLNIYGATLLAAFGTLQIADVITTRWVLENGGWEGNPIMAFMMTLFGDYWVVPKLAVVFICMVFMIRWKPRNVAPFVVLMGGVVANNALWAYA